MTEQKVDIKLDNESRTYTPGDTITGVITVDAGNRSLSHQGIVLKIDGSVKLQLSAKSVGIFEAFYSTLKPLVIVQKEIDILKSGSFKYGKHTYPFSFKLQAVEGMQLFDTYHGVYINVQYEISTLMKRGMMKKDLSKSMEFYVEVYSEVQEAKRHPFKISPDQLQNVHSGLKSKIPQFLFEGHLEHVICDVTQPFTGEFVIQQCSLPIKSIELQLVRVERCPYMEGEAREATEVQNIQIADGDVVPHLPIAIHMILPRLFTCATLNTKNFKLDFEVNLHVVFIDNHMVTENFPLKLYRSRRKKVTGIMSGMW
mmetsp:Transcript_419/g.697  ORF Transcript_419/g.697 Transcript_419/m.697 type:complete len:313 (+) Transcript_419:263-1201(+)|eukprot:CAMPEP_0197524408 /NCGR_PEP_ID=MMETSP1318-20131121/9096_1 /TAXON_ID=552666 /ORGANISM="Partenskyella glossopodia, Strain RCC365" /LENGTH=312 /DNA_ID=CAMNT_0043077361 /DNA_START=141 /DNA_END=1079 /DNA_ORIENTATION=-